MTQETKTTTQETKPNFAKTVWETLSTVNVNNHTEKKQNLTYLSWAWAWGVLMQYYPNSTYEILPDVSLADGSVECWVKLTVSDGEQSLTRKMWLPVMDFRNQAMTNPNSVAINKTRMRCLAKAIAMFGLGHYIYAGEDLPSEDDNTQSAPKPAPRQQPVQQAPKPAYPDDKIKANISSWQELILQGKKTPTDIINMVSTQFTLSNEQLATIRGLAQ